MIYENGTLLGFGIQTAPTAAQWTTGRLTSANLRYVRELPQGPIRVEEGMAICHGSPLDEDTYVFSDLDAFEIFSVHEVPVTFFQSMPRRSARTWSLMSRLAPM